MIVAVGPADVIARCRQAFGLPEQSGCAMDEPMLAALLRRAAGILCPCSRAALRTALLENLQHLGESEDALSERIGQCIEELIIGGDFLELADVITDEAEVKGTWVFGAPPSFIIRPSGSIFLIGILPDQEAFLPRSLGSRVVNEGFTRLIVPEPQEDLGAHLRALGLQELPENVWLKAPKPETATNLLDIMMRRLMSQPQCVTFQDLQIIDPVRHVTYYRGRWASPTNQTGVFVARRPQEYGAPIWCLVRLAKGAVCQILDLPLRGFRWRGCDAAWHMQMAIDFVRGVPQLYRQRHVEAGVVLDFFSPLPQWARRRLMILGTVMQPEKCLFSYWIPAGEADVELKFLRDRLYLAPTDDSE